MIAEVSSTGFNVAVPDLETTTPAAAFAKLIGNARPLWVTQSDYARDGGKVLLENIY